MSVFSITAFIASVIFLLLGLGTGSYSLAFLVTGLKERDGNMIVNGTFPLILISAILLVVGGMMFDFGLSLV